MDINSVKPVSQPVPGYPGTDPTNVGTVPGVSPTDPHAVQQAQKQVPVEPAKDPNNKKDVEDVLEKLNKAAMIFDRSLKFQIHETSHTLMVSVIDSSNNKVIREIPSKEILDIFGKMQDYLGLIFDKKA